MLLAGFVLMLDCAKGQDSAEPTFMKQELPGGGQFVPHPRNPKEIYYLSSIRTLRGGSNPQGQPGLYHSSDDGGTWHLLCVSFDFRALFVHPVSGKLYAIIHDRFLHEGQDGYLATGIIDRAITSTDGRKWSEIRGKRTDAASVSRIFQDPDHPARVCLEVWTVRTYVLQSVDDAYSDWKWIKQWDWDAAHPKEGK
ncbi:MAG: hypothetical protein EOP85_01795 [Verrucomicrobiaceae bacterium]|nr:MAG: hypothetical protein EOP85_01795 [Verrucomicrobiaceae bacterium]